MLGIHGGRAFVSDAAEIRIGAAHALEPACHRIAMAADFSAPANAPPCFVGANGRIVVQRQSFCLRGRPAARFRPLCYQQAHDSYGIRVGENFHFFQAESLL
ncbi:hypothetical protein [Bradyrhizobium elkanii]|uniref:hypothetical protein n=1 Tax=Bradyrhizobium elkanii TaxID=29448 RepID=UPI001AEC97A8|nr:hypothetical protein [Bradyrhizobium elkanii]